MPTGKATMHPEVDPSVCGAHLAPFPQTGASSNPKTSGTKSNRCRGKKQGFNATGRGRFAANFPFATKTAGAGGNFAFAGFLRRKVKGKSPTSRTVRREVNFCGEGEKFTTKVNTKVKHLFNSTNMFALLRPLTKPDSVFSLLRL